MQGDQVQGGMVGVLGAGFRFQKFALALIVHRSAIRVNDF